MRLDSSETDFHMSDISDLSIYISDSDEEPQRLFSDLKIGKKISSSDANHEIQTLSKEELLEVDQRISKTTGVSTCLDESLKGKNLNLKAKNTNLG